MHPSQLLDFAIRTLGAGNLAAAEIACRDLLDFEPRNAAALHMLGFIASRAGEKDLAVAYFRSAEEIEPDNARIRENLEAAQKMLPPRLPPGERYLLIKSWGFGFWADMAHVIGSLLLAEITGRIPLVFWGPESRFSDKSQSDGFGRFFEPVSAVGLWQLAQMQNASFFPPRWHAGNLTQSGVSKWEGKGSRAGAVFFLNRPETIAVSDFNIGVVHVMPWIPPQHALYGKSLDEIYHYLTAKYLRPRADIVAACDAVCDVHLAGRPFVAVHLRGSDKIKEDAALNATNAEILAALDAVDPSWPIFLLTDDAHYLARMKARYGGRIVATDCQRTETEEGVHYLSTVDPVQAGREIMIDTYLALRANRFIGNGLSNVSAMIAVLKDWPAENLTLIGRSLLMDRNLHLYEVPTFSKA